MNPVKKSLQSQEILVGTFLSIDSPELAEALSLSGLDWLVFDWEHAPFSTSALQHMTQAVRPPCLSFIRIPEPEGVYVKKALDTGCDGIIVPQVNSGQIARTVVSAGKYAPLGQRGVGLSRSTEYGARLAEALRTHNEDTSIFIQIEHADAVENLEEILRTPGIDGIFVGPYDLASSMGFSGDVQHPQVQAAIARVLTSAAAHQLTTATFIASDELLLSHISKGFKLIAVGSDLLRLTASARTTARFRDEGRTFAG